MSQRSKGLISEHQNSRQFLSGGGELGHLIRSLDWSKNPLGSPEYWPQSLKTSVSVCIDSGFPMLVCWGQQFIMIYNDSYIPVLGKKHPQALGQPLLECWHEIKDILSEMFGSVVNTGNAIYAEDLMFPLGRHGFTEECYFTFSYSPIRDETGGVGGILVTCSETSGRVIAARRLKTLRDLANHSADAKATIEAFQSFSDVFKENTNDLPFALLYHLTNNNKELQLVSCCGLKEGSSVAPLNIPIDSKEQLWKFEETIISGKPIEVKIKNDLIPENAVWPEPCSLAYMIPVFKSDKNNLHGILVCGISPRLFFDDDYKSFLGLIANQISITLTNVEAFEKEKQRAELLSEIDKAKTTFFSNVSHEFRTPLTLMLSPLEQLLENDFELPGPVKQNLVIIHRNCLRLLKLVNSLLDFSRIEAGRMHAIFEKVDIASYTSEIASSFRSAVESAGLKYEVQCEPVADEVYVDVDMWEKIILNLISNAFKFTHEGHIKINLKQAGEYIELSVQDTGIGIEESEQQKIFERFHRVEKTSGRSQEGTGIGLALVLELVKLHHGSIKVKSKPGKGSDFIVSIPVGKQHFSPEKILNKPHINITSSKGNPYVEEALRWLPETERQKTSIQNNKNNKPIVLLADDNADMRDYIKRLLENEYDVVTVENGRQALMVMKNILPQLVIADVMMPQMDGFELLKNIKADARFSHIPVMMLSARAGEEATIEGLEAGADDYLVKPFSAKELMSRVHAQLRIVESKSQLEKELQHLFMQAPVPIAVYRGENYLCEIANAPCLEMIQKKPEEFIGKPLFESMPELKGQNNIEGILDNVRKTGERFIGKELPFEVMKKGKKTPGFYNFVYEPIKDENGNTQRIMVVVQEVTEQVFARKKIEEAIEGMKILEQRKDDFIRMASHELKTPITSIQGYVQLLQSLLSDEGNEKNIFHTANLKSSLSIIDKQVKKLTRLLGELLDLSRIETGRLELNKQLFDLNDLVMEAVRDIKHTDIRHQINMIHDFYCEVFADKDRIYQVLINIINNAAKYSQQAKEIQVRIFQPAENFVAISIKDFGIGIDKNEHQKIFERFYRVEGKNEQTYPGFGIGLFIADEIMERHEGKIAVESKKGEGSMFTIYLPLNW